MKTGLTVPAPPDEGLGHRTGKMAKQTKLIGVPGVEFDKENGRQGNLGNSSGETP